MTSRRKRKDAVLAFFLFVSQGIHRIGVGCFCGLEAHSQQGHHLILRPPFFLYIIYLEQAILI